MTDKFKVSPQTIRSDIRALGLAAKRDSDNEEKIDLEMQACVQRLLSRAQRDDNVGNRADELLMNAMGVRSAKRLKNELDDQKARIETARANILEAKAEIAALEADKAIKSAASQAKLNKEFTDTLERIKRQRAVSVKDILSLTCLYVDAEIARGPDTDMRQVLASLRHLTRISLADPASAGAEHQLFALPEGMRFDVDPLPDEGDNLMED